MSSGSMTSRGNTLPGLAGLLSRGLGDREYHAGNESFPREGLPRVALMFLTRGPLPYESVWRDFLSGIPDKQQGISHMISNHVTCSNVGAVHLEDPY